ncbi:NAD-dependent epimerase/dehydratase family protein [Siccirubricoccus sp. KC 17139]|uniref:NAD-dependent epimerase/dehydratase family protein n=1 Tax=Siccirubricoccus soli TaxID=2899147 RepID=A0ABT1DAI9_9PROT|nr:NAD-dependent epimerase/dehydratase family protein [Siccirubricoccus soli]MCO6418955.1 NAD-dependent epimerase/dehydratase family protein [Siccirubricoccus soli]MCP2685090.1 NAD-dependent epimerase/dehydratase family protein [Siccirubricoccus soli]
MSLLLVTGGAGFIGAHLVEALLRQGHAVRVVDDLSTGHRASLPAEAELVVGEVADAALMRRAAAGVAGIFHLAAIGSPARSGEAWLATHRTNQTGTVSVLEAARAAGGVPVVYASSAAIYGDQGQGPVAEAARPAPLTAYGADKLGSELHAAVAFGVHGVPTLGCRLFSVYGPRQDPRSPAAGVIARFAARLARGERLVVHGDGLQGRDFVYVEDAVAHLLAGMALLRRTPQALVLNVCTGRPTAITALAETMARLAGRPAALGFGPARVGDIRHLVGNPQAAIAALGVAARTTLEMGLMATLGSMAPGMLLAA